MGSEKPKKEAQSEDIRIVVLQRGWVVVGRYAQDGDRVFVRNGAVIRSWGTTKGLGEIAEGGPTERTRLDALPEVEAHALAVVLTVRCEASKWTGDLR